METETAGRDPIDMWKRRKMRVNPTGRIFATFRRALFFVNLPSAGA